MNPVEFRYATEDDVDKILFFIKGIAEYEKMSDEVVTTEALLREWVFEKKSAEVIFAMEDGTEVGFALFFHNFSTFVGRAGIYLEDIFVLPEHRKKGYGKALFTQVAKIAAEQGVVASEQIAAKAMQNCNLVCIAGEEMQRIASAMLSALFEANPKSVGGALPDDAFYAALS